MFGKRPVILLLFLFLALSAQTKPGVGFSNGEVLSEDFHPGEGEFLSYKIYDGEFKFRANLELNGVNLSELYFDFEDLQQFASEYQPHDDPHEVWPLIESMIVDGMTLDELVRDHNSFLDVFKVFLAAARDSNSVALRRLDSGE